MGKTSYVALGDVSEPLGSCSAPGTKLGRGAMSVKAGANRGSKVSLAFHMSLKSRTYFLASGKVSECLSDSLAKSRTRLSGISFFFGQL
jgi:hypothetical protein